MRLVGDRQADVVVLGAGIAGWAVALELARRRRRVAVIEASTPDASDADLGHVSTGTGSPYSEVVRRRGRATALRIWETHRENHERLRSFLAGLGDDCGYRQAGGFLLAEDRVEAAALADSEDALRDDGFSGEFLDHYMLEARFDVTGFAGAYWAADDGEVDAVRLVRALGSAAAEHGAAFFEPSPLLDLDLSARGAEVVTARGRIMAKEAVVALETVSPGLVPFLSSRLVPLEARGLAPAVDPERALPTPARMARGEVGWRWTAGELRLAGAGDLEGVARRLGAAGGARATSRGPAAGSVDGLPLIGRLPDLPVVAACGYGRLGLAYALVGARWASEALATGRDPTPAPFRADRPLPRAD